jgi:hypothetical protein
MVCEQNKYVGIIWNSEKREFTFIVTLRNILELIIQVCEGLKIAFEEAIGAENTGISGSYIHD